MEKFVEQTLLYDFYGELLTERQQQVYESVVLEDYSLSEVAEDLGISRQGVHDMIKRCNHTLEDYEARLHLVEKFAEGWCAKDSPALPLVAELQPLLAELCARYDRSIRFWNTDRKSVV